MSAPDGRVAIAGPNAAGAGPRRCAHCPSYSCPRLDSHDFHVPPGVWGLLAWTAQNAGRRRFDAHPYDGIDRYHRSIAAFPSLWLNHYISFVDLFVPVEAAPSPEPKFRCAHSIADLAAFSSGWRRSPANRRLKILLGSGAYIARLSRCAASTRRMRFEFRQEGKRKRGQA
jgi:hypothetical protein